MKSQSETIDRTDRTRWLTGVRWTLTVLLLLAVPSQGQVALVAAVSEHVVASESPASAESTGSDAALCCPETGKGSGEAGVYGASGQEAPPCCPGNCSECSVLCCKTLPVVPSGAAAAGNDALMAQPVFRSMPRFASAEPSGVFHPPRV